MKRKLLWTFGLLLAFVVMLLVTAPATVLTRTATTLVPALGFSGVSGSLWHGEVAQLRYRTLAVRQLRWQLSPWRLLLGQAAVQLNFGSEGEATGSAAVHAGVTGQLTVTDLAVRLPASALQPLISVPGVGLAGELQLDVPDLAYTGGQVERLQGRLLWLQAMVRTPLGQPALGSYAVDLGSDGEGGIVGELSDIDGVLGLSGRVQVSTTALSLDGSVRADLPEELDRFFRVIGRPDGDRYQIQWQQPLRR